MTKNKTYNLETSPFYDKDYKVRASLSEFKASEGEDVVLARKRFFKQDEYAKFIIHDEFDITKFHSLSRMAVTILHYIVIYCLEYNTPTFRFKVKDFALILGVNSPIIYKGLKQLKEHNYIADTRTKEVYWINHNYFYKGNFKIDKYLIKKSK